MTRAKFVAGGAAALGLIGSGIGIAAAQNVPLRFNIFGGIDAWPVYVMNDKKFLASAGYDMVITTTAGSVAQFQHLLAGDADIAYTAMDNIVAYDSGAGDASVTGNFDFAAMVGVGQGFLRLVVRPEITSYDQLRGKVLAVDAPSTGFSFVLRRMLEKNGVMPGDYSFTAVGNTQKRFDAMVAGQAVGGVVGAPFDLLGVQKYGFHVLGNAIDILGHYEASVIMARRSWAAANKPAMHAVVAAYRKAAAWLYAPANRTEAMAILVRNTDLTADLVAQIAPIALSNPSSYSKTGKIDVDGVNMVMQLRAAYATPMHPAGNPNDFIDASYL